MYQRLENGESRGAKDSEKLIGSLRVSACLLAACLIVSFNSISSAQTAAQASSPSTVPAANVPRLIRIHGVVLENSGKPASGGMAITFSLYKDETDQTAVWQETQNVQLDPAGHYSVLLGVTNDAGLPLEIFSTGDARWLGVRPDGQVEQPRILFLSVAYALKAADSEMLGGKPASAFVLAASQYSSAQAISTGVTPNTDTVVTPATACSSLTSDGTATSNQITKFTAPCNLENSAIFESGGNVGIGNTNPAGTLDVSGSAFIRGLLTAPSGALFPATGTATAAQGFVSNPAEFRASTYNSSITGPVSYLFQWEAEPSGNDTSNTAATMNLLFGVPGDVFETGFSITRNGIVNFAPGQTFPGTGSGTVTSVATGAGLTGGPITGSGTISIPTAGVTNAMLANSSVTVKAGAGLSGGGSVALGGTVTLTSAATGTVTSVASGTGLSGGPITSSGTLSLNTSFTDGRYLQLSGGVLSGALTGTTGAFTGGLAASTGTFSSTVSAAGALLPDTGTATSGKGFNSNPLDLQASSFSSKTSSAIAQDFRWMAEPTGNDTSSPSSSLNLLFGLGGATPAETGFSIASNGLITFASGQTFPGGGSGGGTVTNVNTGAGLTGGPITTAGTISIPAAGVTNAMLANPSITVKAGSGLSGGGTVALGGTVTLTNTASGGTVTSVATGAGLTGGPVTTTGTISIPAAGVTNSMLANPSITVVPGSGLSGGGTVALGGSVTLSSNLSGTTDGIAYFSGATNLSSTAAPTNGQILIGSTGKAPVLATLAAGSNVSITNGPGSVTISAAGGGGGGSPLQFFATGGQHTGAAQAATHNLNKVWGFLLPYNVTTTEVVYDVTTADNTANDYDIGIFDASGNLLVDIGPTAGTKFSPAKGFRTLIWTQGSTSLTAGRYYLALTTNCSSSCAAVAASPAFVSFAIDLSAGASTGGALSSTITVPADLWGSGNQPTVVVR
jgi:trimeric autotransporter adhesin